MTIQTFDAASRPQAVFHDGRNYLATGRVRAFVKDSIARAFAEYRCFDNGAERRVWADERGRVEFTSPGAYKVGDKVATGGGEEEGVVEEVLQDGRRVMVKWEDDSRSNVATNSLVPSTFSMVAMAKSADGSELKIGDRVEVVGGYSGSAVTGRVSRIVDENENVVEIVSSGFTGSERWRGNSLKKLSAFSSFALTPADRGIAQAALDDAKRHGLSDDRTVDAIVSALMSEGGIDRATATREAYKLVPGTARTFRMS